MIPVTSALGGKVADTGISGQIKSRYWWRSNLSCPSLVSPMEKFSSISCCRICGSPDLTPIVSLGDQCLTGVFPRPGDPDVTRGPLDLVKCTGGSTACGLVQLRHTYNKSEMYGAGYGYRSSLNRSMVNHLRDKAEAIQRMVSLAEGDFVVDIGSNDGTSLSFYPDNLERVGIDPTGLTFREYYGPGIHLIPDFFSAHLFDGAFGGRKAKVVTSIAMLYDLDDPLAFAREVESVLDEEGIWHFEQSYMPLMLETTGYDTICHEHVEYYALTQIDWILRRADLRIIDVGLNDVNGGSFAVTACKASASPPRGSSSAARILAREHEQELVGMRPFEEFASRVQDHRDSLPELLRSLSEAGSLVIGYGASTKGNVILQYCGIGTELVPCVAEINADKFGAFTPGSGIPIVSEEEARAMDPDFFLAMPWHFRPNLLAREAAFLGSGGKMIFPLPRIDIVGREPS